MKERRLYSIRLLIFGEWRDWRIEMVWDNLGALVTARRRDFWMLAVMRSQNNELQKWRFSEQRRTGVNDIGCFNSMYGSRLIQRSSRMWDKQDLEGWDIWSEMVRCSSKMKRRLRAEWVMLNGQQLSILANCCLSPIWRNSALEKLRVGRSAVIQKICCRAFWRWVMLERMSAG